MITSSFRRTLSVDACMKLLRLRSTQAVKNLQCDDGKNRLPEWVVAILSTLGIDAIDGTQLRFDLAIVDSCIVTDSPTTCRVARNAVASRPSLGPAR